MNTRCLLLLALAAITSSGCEEHYGCTPPQPTGNFVAKRDALTLDGSMMRESPGRASVSVGLVPFTPTWVDRPGDDVIAFVVSTGSVPGELRCWPAPPPPSPVWQFQVDAGYDGDAISGDTASSDTSGGDAGASAGAGTADAGGSGPDTSPSDPEIFCTLGSTLLDVTVTARTGPPLDATLKAPQSGSIDLRVSGEVTLPGGAGRWTLDGVRIHAEYTWREVMQTFACG